LGGAASGEDPTRIPQTPRVEYRVLATCSYDGENHHWDVGVSRDSLTIPVHRLAEIDTDSIVLHIKYRRDSVNRRVCTMTSILEAVTGDVFCMHATPDAKDIQPVYVTGKGRQGQLLTASLALWSVVNLPAFSSLVIVCLLGRPVRPGLRQTVTDRMQKAASRRVHRPQVDRVPGSHINMYI